MIDEHGVLWTEFILSSAHHDKDKPLLAIINRLYPSGHIEKYTDGEWKNTILEKNGNEGTYRLQL